MKCYDIIEKLESLSPTAFAEEWDNVGLLAGRRDKEVHTIYIALDATDEVIKEACALAQTCCLRIIRLFLRSLTELIRTIL